jgi:N-acetyl-gamma-glutamylphosphate reductase
MIERVYVQKSVETGEFVNSNVYSAWYGFESLGVETVPFTWPELFEGRVELAREAAVVGGIPTGLPLPAR